MRQPSLFFKNALLQFTFFISFCMMTVFTVLYMQSLGFTTLHTGIIFGLANFFGAWLQMITGQMADSSKVVTIKEVLLAHAGIAALAMVPLAFFSASGFVVLASFFVFSLLAQAVQGPINAVSVAFEQAGYPIQFSVIRGIGSASYGLTSLLAGMYFDHHPLTQLPLLLFVSMTLFCLVIFLLPPVPVGQRRPGVKAVGVVDPPTQHFYRKYPLFIPLVIGFTLLFAGHMVINTYLALLVKNVGGGATEAGIAVSCAIVMEVISLFSYGHLRRHVSDRFLMGIAALVFTIKAIILYFATNVFWVYISQLFQFATFPFFTAGISYFSAAIVEKKDLVKGQNVVTIIMSLGGAVGSLLGGIVLNFLSVPSALLATVGISLAGSVIALTGIRQAGAWIKAKQNPGKKETHFSEERTN